MTTAAQVSSEEERLILVDTSDRIVGYTSKAKAHDDQGILHRAFSIFIVNAQGEVLLQQRSPTKRLWPLYWSNSCCSHPREGESYEESTLRRLREELGLVTELHYLYRFSYQARFRDKGSEYELCSVYIGRVHDTDRVEVNINEIADWKWVSPDEIDRLLREESDQLTPWFKLEWERIRSDHPEALDL